MEAVSFKLRIFCKSLSPGYSFSPINVLIIWPISATFEEGRLLKGTMLREVSQKSGYRKMRAPVTWSQPLLDMKESTRAKDFQHPPPLKNLGKCRDQKNRDHQFCFQGLVCLFVCFAINLLRIRSWDITKPLFWERCGLL